MVWLDFQASLVGTVAGVIADMQALAEFEGELVVSQEGVENLMTALRDVASWILTAVGDVSSYFDEAGNYVDALKAKWLEIQAGLVGTVAGVVDGIKKIAEFEGVDEATFSGALTNLFTALDAFLSEFQARATAFAGRVDEEVAALAQTIGRVVSDLGSAVEPLINILEYAPEVTDVDSAIREFFEHLGRVLAIIEEEKEEWQVSDAARELLGAVEEATSQLGQVAASLSDIIGYSAESGNALDAFNKFKQDLIDIVATINEAREKVGTDALAAAQQFAEDCQTILSNIQAGMSHLNTLEGLGAEPENLIEAGTRLVTSLVDGFVEASEEQWERLQEAFWAFVDAIRAYVDEELVGIISTAGENLGAAFIQGWIDGLEQNASRLYQTIQSIVDQVVAVARSAQWVISTAGENLGAAFIQGWIDGLEQGAGWLYAVIQSIVQQAIAAARAAADVSSPSREMYRLGSEMVAGMAKGLQDGRAEVARIMDGLVAATMPEGLAVRVRPAPAAAYAMGGRPAPAALPAVERRTGWGPVEINVATQDPAPIAREVDLAMRRLLLQAELEAMRG